MEIYNLQKKGGFCFIATVLDIEIELPVQITSCLRLESASPEQRRSLLELSLGNIGLDPHRNYKYSRKEVKTETAHGFILNPLDKEDWKYYIISFSGAEQELYKLLYIADLISPHITSYITYSTSEEFGQGNVTSKSIDSIGQSSFYVNPLHVAKKFNPTDLEKLQKKLHEYNNIYENTQYEGIIRAIETNWNLKKIYNINNLMILGLFMIIEMLLTHNPNDKELGDSLNHQIKTKMAFLDSRFDTKLDYSVFGENINPSTLWGKLYDYRSCIAHGNHIDFKNKLQMLKNENTAFEFLNTATRALLAHALKEPDVVNGLKPI